MKSAIAASIAEAYHGIPDWLREECRSRISEDMLEVVNQFDRALNR